MSLRRPWPTRWSTRSLLRCPGKMRSGLDGSQGIVVAVNAHRSFLERHVRPEAWEARWGKGIRLQADYSLQDRECVFEIEGQPARDMNNL
mgnify:CR=1 FL=1